MNQNDSKDLKLKIVITGGGSGGHISPAQAVIDEFKLRYTNALDKILYIGGDLGMEGDSSGKSVEQKIYENSDINFVAIRAGKLQRYFSWKTVQLLFRVIGGFFDARKQLKKFKPDMIFSTGGFVTVPVCIVGKLMGIPVYIHEQTSSIGLTNKIVSKFAKRIFIAFNSSFQHFPRKKTILTGNPVRQSIFKTQASPEIQKQLNVLLNNKVELSKPILLIMGGGQGSHLINETIASALPNLIQKYQIVLQTGSNEQFKDFEMLNRRKEALPPEYQSHFLPMQFINSEDIGAFFHYSDMFIGRAGANLVYEVALLKKRSIFIPIPWVTNNEQEKNANTLVRQGLSSIVQQEELSPQRLIEQIDYMITVAVPKDFDETLFPTNAAEKIVTEIMKDYN